MPDWATMGIICLVLIGLMMLRLVKLRLRGFALVRLNMMGRVSSQGQKAGQENTRISDQSNKDDHPG